MEIPLLRAPELLSAILCNDMLLGGAGIIMDNVAWLRSLGLEGIPRERD